MPEPKLRIFEQFAQENGLKEQETRTGVDPKEAYVSVIIQKYGPPAYENDKRQLSKINETFWAALYARENLITYDPVGCQFYRYNSHNGCHELTSQAAIGSQIAERIFSAS